jgi:hypothetical protein
MSDTVEAQFLYSTLLSDELLPFGWRNLSLVVLPLADGKLLTFRDAIRRGKDAIAMWLRKAESLWLERRKSAMELFDRLDWHGKLTAQHPTGVYKVLYNASGTHLCACVVDTDDPKTRKVFVLQTQGFIADTTTYWLETNNMDEVHYLCACLNSPCVDRFIKPFQPKGAFGALSGKGERHIHRRPFEVLPIPLFDPSNNVHLRLSDLSKQCHTKVAEFVATADQKTLSQPVGRLRQVLRDFLKGELAEIDNLVHELLSSDCARV